MLGFNHVTLGAIAGAATLPIAPVHDTGGQALWVVVFAGFSLLPDLDQSGSSVSRMWGPITDVASGVVGQVAGGHREGTHDLVMAPVIAFALFSALVWIGPWGQMIAIAVAIGLMLKGLSLLDLGRTGSVANATMSWAGAWLVVDAGLVDYLGWLPMVAAGGVIAHALGDLPTRTGIPVPLARLTGSTARWYLGWFSTGQWAERLVVTPALSGALMGVLAWQTGITSLGELHHAVLVVADAAGSSGITDVLDVVERVARPALPA